MSLLGGWDRQRKEGVQEGPLFGADDQEQKEESGGAKAIEENERSNGAIASAIKGIV